MGWKACGHCWKSLEKYSTFGTLEITSAYYSFNRPKAGSYVWALTSGQPKSKVRPILLGHTFGTICRVRYTIGRICSVVPRRMSSCYLYYLQSTFGTIKRVHLVRKSEIIKMPF